MGGGGGLASLEWHVDQMARVRCLGACTGQRAAVDIDSKPMLVCVWGRGGGGGYGSQCVDIKCHQHGSVPGPFQAWREGGGGMVDPSTCGLDFDWREREENQFSDCGDDRDARACHLPVEADLRLV